MIGASRGTTGAHGGSPGAILDQGAVTLRLAAEASPLLHLPLLLSASHEDSGCPAALAGLTV